MSVSTTVSSSTSLSQQVLDPANHVPEVSPVSRDRLRKPHVPSGIWHMFDHFWPLEPNVKHQPKKESQTHIWIYLEREVSSGFHSRWIPKVVNHIRQHRADLLFYKILISVAWIPLFAGKTCRIHRFCWHQLEPTTAIKLPMWNKKGKIQDVHQFSTKVLPPLKNMFQQRPGQFRTGPT